MSDKIMLNFRCPSEVLEAINNLGKERYPANTKHGCDRSKTLMDIMRAGIEALSDGSVVLPTLTEVRQPVSDNLDERITEIIERKTEGIERKTQLLLTELADIKASQASAISQLRAEMGESAA
jgi:hypothetical protein